MKLNSDKCALCFTISVHSRITITNYNRESASWIAIAGKSAKRDPLSPDILQWLVPIHNRKISDQYRFGTHKVCAPTKSSLNLEPKSEKRKCMLMPWVMIRRIAFVEKQMQMFKIYLLMTFLMKRCFAFRPFCRCTRLSGALLSSAWREFATSRTTMFADMNRIRSANPGQIEFYWVLLGFYQTSSLISTMQILCQFLKSFDDVRTRTRIFTFAVDRAFQRSVCFWMQAFSEKISEAAQLIVLVGRSSLGIG